MAKPASVKYEWVSCVIDGVIARRVQTLGSSTDFAEEQILELGDKGYAETTDTPTVSITIDTNDWGSVNTIALLSNLYQTAFASDNGGYKTADTPGDNSYVITQDSFETAAVDITAPVSEDGISLDRTLYLSYAFINSLSFSYDVGGVATENYSLESDFKRWYLTDHKSVVVYEAAYSAADTANIPLVDLSSGYTGLVVSVEGIIVSDQLTSSSRPGLGSTITLAAGAGTSTDVTSASPALALTSGDRIRVLVSENSATEYTWLTSTPAGIGGAKKGLIEIHMSDSTTTLNTLGPVDGEDDADAANRTLRVQSLSIDVDLSREVLEELGNYRAYSRTVQTPIAISATVSVNDSDLEMWADLSKIAWNGDLDELDIEDFAKTSIVEVRIFKDKKDHTIDTTGTNGTTDGDNTLLKVVRLENCSVSGESHSVSVGGIAQQEFTLSAESIIISGTALSPLI